VHLTSHLSSTKLSFDKTAPLRSARTVDCQIGMASASPASTIMRHHAIMPSMMRKTRQSDRQPVHSPRNASAKEQCLCQFPSLRYVHTHVRTCTYFHHQIRHTCALGNHNCLHQSQGLFLLSQLESLMLTTYHHYTTTITNKLYATLLLVSSNCYITCTSHHHPRYEDQNRKARLRIKCVFFLIS
jgi:hypothetical protein